MRGKMSQDTDGTEPPEVEAVTQYSGRAGVSYLWDTMETGRLVGAEDMPPVPRQEEADNNVASDGGMRWKNETVYIPGNRGI